MWGGDSAFVYYPKGTNNYYNLLHNRIIETVDIGDIDFCDLLVKKMTDGTIDSYEQNPVFTYSETGTYDVKLKATFGAIIDSLIKTNFIIVQESPLLSPQKTSQQSCKEIYSH